MNAGRALLITILVFGAAWGVVHAADQPKTTTGQEFSCPVPSGFRAAETAAEIPAIIQEKLKDQFDGDLAMLGTRWNSSDVMGGGMHHAGVEFVLHRGKRWIAGVGRGGLAASLQIWAFDLNRDQTETTNVFSDVPEDEEDFCGAVAVLAR
jgi:hypothetical protein